MKKSLPEFANFNDYMMFEALKEGTLFIAEYIDTCFAREIISQIGWLDANLSDEKDVKVVITCDGGEVFAGLAIYDSLVMLKETRKVNVAVVGLAASMAAIILQAGTLRTATPNSRLLIHEVRQFKVGEERPSDMREEAEEMSKVSKILADILSKSTGRSSEEIERIWNKKDVWLSAEEALEFGLIDGIFP